MRLVPGAAAYGSQLQVLLADPQTAPLLAAPSLRRRLNPLCHMLGVPEPPPCPIPVPPAPVAMDRPEFPATADPPSAGNTASRQAPDPILPAPIAA